MTQLLQPSGDRLFNAKSLDFLESEKKCEVAYFIIYTQDKLFTTDHEQLALKIFEKHRFPIIKIKNVIKQFGFPFVVYPDGGVDRSISCTYDVELNDNNLIKYDFGNDVDKPIGSFGIGNKYVYFIFETSLSNNVDDDINKIEASFQKTKENFDKCVNKMNGLIGLINERLLKYIEETLTNEINARQNIQQIKEQYGTQTNYPL